MGFEEQREAGVTGVALVTVLPGDRPCPLLQGQRGLGLSPPALQTGTEGFSLANVLQVNIRTSLGCLKQFISLLSNSR